MIDLSKLKIVQEDIVVTLCLLEKYFPPTLFTIMVHLVVNPVKKVEFCGPVYLRWMYPFERYMKVLKICVQNRSQPKGCIGKNSIVKEVIEFCYEFIYGVDSIGLNSSTRKANSNMDIASSIASCIRPSKDQLDQVYFMLFKM